MSTEQLVGVVAIVLVVVCLILWEIFRAPDERPIDRRYFDDEGNELDPRAFDPKCSHGFKFTEHCDTCALEREEERANRPS